MELTHSDRDFYNHHAAARLHLHKENDTRRRVRLAVVSAALFARQFAGRGAGFRDFPCLPASVGESRQLADPVGK
jgi:hypothetical protein